MSGSVNKVILVGRLGADPDVRSFSNGGKVVNLSVATSERWRDKGSGEQREKTEWHRVAIFNDRLGDVAERFLKKGSSVYLEGALETRKWQDQNGQDKYTTEVVLKQYRGELTLLGGRNEGQGGGMGGGDSYGGGGNSSYGNQGRDDFGGGSMGGNSGGGFGQNNSGGGSPIDLDDDIPF